MSNRLWIVLCLALLTACQQQNTLQTTSQKPTQTPTRTTATEPRRQSGPAPTETELRAAIQRTYADAVTVDRTNPTPFILGDFNGDNSEDIAIVVKPRSERLSELNNEYVNWTLEDPRHIEQIARGVAAKDSLLAVIHGREQQGWRNDLARQTYLLKNAVGTEFATESVNQLRTTGEAKSLPALRGDVIREKLNGSGGIIYWTGGKYAWHPLT